MRVSVPTCRIGNSYLKQCGVLANYWTKSLRKSFSSPVCSYYITDNTSQPETLILETALTEVTYRQPSDRPGQHGVRGPG